MSERKFFRSMAATVIVIMGIVTVVNLVIDVGQAFRNRNSDAYVDDYVRRLVRSAHGLIYNAMFERQVKYRLAETINADCYVTGSSHEWTIDLERAPKLRTFCKTLVNLGVSAGGYSDAVTLIAPVAKRGHAAIFVGIDPWFFRMRVDARSYSESDEAYQDARRYFGLRPLASSRTRADRLLNLVNGEYFLRNIQELVNAKGEILPPIVEAPAGIISEDVWRPNGVLSYRSFVANVQDFPPCTEYAAEPPYVEQAVVDEFDSILEQLERRDVTVFFILMPYHPGLFRCGGNTVPSLHAAEQAARTLATKRSLQVIGSFEPSPFGLQPSDFMDPFHVISGSVHKVLGAPAR